MQVQYSLTHSDLRAFAQFCTPVPAWAKNRWLNILSWVVGILLIALAMAFLEEILSIDWHHIFNGMLWACGTILLIFVGYLILASRQVRRHFDQPLTATFEAEGLTQSDGVTRSVTPWKAVQRIGQSPKHLFFVFGFHKGLIVPTREFEDPALVGQIVARAGELCPGIEVEQVGAIPRQTRKIYNLLAVLGVLLFLASTPWMLDPLRDRVELPGDLGSVSYRVTTTAGADPSEPLPLIVFLNPLGGFPEIFPLVKRKWDFPARVVVPAGPKWHWIGYSWFGFDDDWDTFVADVRQSSDTVAAFTQLMTERYPTQGKPIVTGLSQGASVAYALAAYHPERFAASVPVSGALAGDIPERETPPDIKVHGFHGQEDEIVLPSWAQYNVDQMREQGWAVTFNLYPDRGHAIGSEAKDAWRSVLAELAAEQARQEVSQ